MTDRIWILLASEDALPLQTKFFQPLPGTNRPVDAFLVTDQPPDILEAAQRGVQAAYQSIKLHGFDIPGLAVGFDLRGITAKRPIIGSSAGLAFALALAQKRLGIKQDIAATGEVISGLGDGEVGRVDEIRSKLKASEKFLVTGGKVFFPRANCSEIDEDLRRELEIKDITLVPVDSVAEAVSYLIEQTGNGVPPAQGPIAKQSTSSSNMHIAVSCILLSILVLLAVLLWSSNWKAEEGSESDMPGGQIPCAKLVLVGGDSLTQKLISNLVSLWKKRELSASGDKEIDSINGHLYLSIEEELAPDGHFKITLKAKIPDLVVTNKYGKEYSLKPMVIETYQEKVSHPKELLQRVAEKITGYFERALEDKKNFIPLDAGPPGQQPKSGILNKTGFD